MKVLRVSTIMLLIIGISVAVYYVAGLYGKEVRNINCKVDDLLPKIVDDELTFRDDIGNVRVAIVDSGLLPIKHYGKNMYIDESGEYEIPKKSVKITVERRIKDCRQTLLATKHKYINVYRLDSLLTAALFLDTVKAQLAFSVTHTPMSTKVDTLFYSVADTGFFAKASYVSSMATGVFDELKIKAYVKYSMWFILGRISYPSSFVLLVTISFMILLFVFIGTYMFKRRIRIQYYTEEDMKAILDNSIHQLENGNWVLGDLFLNTAEYTLYKHDEKIKINNISCKLLLLFLENENYFVTKYMIVDKLWSHKEDCDDRINTNIRRLRIILEADPNLEIVNERTIGYRLIHKKPDSTKV